MLLERSVEVGGRGTRYLEAGSGWPLVLLHAFPLSADMWRPQLEAVPRGWRLLAPDLTGFGPAPRGAAHTLEDMAEDVTAWLDALRIDRAIIGGLSMGGYVTLVLFRIAPDRFEGLVLANTRAAADSDEGREGRDRMSALVREKGPAAVADQMLPKLLGETSLASRPELASRVRGMILGNGAEGLDGALQAMKNRADATPVLSSVGCPALVLTGAEDVLIPLAESEQMHRLLRRSQLATIPRAGHLSNLEASGDFNEALETFLRSNL
jgi:3-oxoadipate enol-lactonase